MRQEVMDMGDPRNRNGNARRKLRARLRAEGRPCHICGQPIDYDAEPGTTPDSLTLDHRYPVSRRPDLQEDPGNFEPAHLSCNARRGDRDPHDSLGTLSRDWAGALRGEGR